MAEVIKTGRILRAAQVIASTVLCYSMQSGYFAFSEKLFDNIGKETHDTGFQ